jgi:hypothetical protein
MDLLVGSAVSQEGVPTRNPEGADLLRFVSQSHSLRLMMPIVVSVLCSIRSLVRARAALHLEVLALRHQLLVLERSQQRRVLLTSTDRLFWVVLSRLWSEWRTALVLVKPQTVVDWHRRGFRLFWTWKSRRCIGRPTVPARTSPAVPTAAVSHPGPGRRGPARPTRAGPCALNRDRARPL